MPQVSILIPNFNNGRQSSVDQAHDQINDMVQSLVDTLQNDPTDLEIIALDDGSTDDSLESLRVWAKTPWPEGSHQHTAQNGGPILRLIEREHRGVLSAVANDLVKESQGQILVRLDGDIVVQTNHWAAKLVAHFDRGPSDLGVIGPKQLSGGNIHSFGDWLLHPRGYHHIGMGLPPQTITTAIECDHVMGCFYCCKRSVYDAIGGYDETILRGQTIDFGLSARLKGFRCFAVPDIVFDHRHRLRHDRSNVADTPQGIEKTLARFEDKWGFDRLAPDLDLVAEKYKGTPLLWNARVFGTMAFNRPEMPTPIVPNDTEWARYTSDQATQQRIHQQQTSIQKLESQRPANTPITVMGCGTGLLVHLLAKQGLPVIGVDHDLPLIDMAKAFCDTQTYPGPKPQFIHEPTGRCVPPGTENTGLWVLWEHIEIHPNPAKLLRELAKHAVPGAVLLATASPTRGHEPAATTGMGAPNPWELHGLVKNCGWELFSGPANFGQACAAVAKAKPQTQTTVHTQPLPEAMATTAETAN